MARHEDQPEEIVGQVAVDDLVDVEFRAGRHRGCDLLVLVPLGVAPSNSVDGEESGGSGQPCGRVVGYALLSPLLECGDEGVLGEFFGGVDVTDESYEAGGY